MTEMKETSTTTRPTLSGKSPRCKFASVLPDENHARVFVKFPGELVDVDVHRMDAGRAVLQKAIGEAAGG